MFICLQGVNVDDWAGYNDANHYEEGAIFIDEEKPQVGFRFHGNQNAATNSWCELR